MQSIERHTACTVDKLNASYLFAEEQGTVELQSLVATQLQKCVHLHLLLGEHGTSDCVLVTYIWVFHLLNGNVV